MSLQSDNQDRLVERLFQALAREDDTAELIETHISWVLLAGDFAYKLKKALDLGFLDFSTLDRRHHFCEEEIRLNSRLAPDIYLDVIPVTGSIERPSLHQQGRAIEYAVRMKRFRKAVLLSRHPESLSESLADELARRIVGFHMSIARVADDQPFGLPDRVLSPMQQNFDQIRSLDDIGDMSGRLHLLESWTRTSFRSLRPLLIERKASGFVRECHGDLHLGNIALEGDRLIIFDGIEFNPDLRWIDTISELAFLVMDIEEKGRPGLAHRLTNVYLEMSGDYQGLTLLRFYQTYRAMVRAKVVAIRMHQEDVSSGEKAQLAGELAAYLEKALEYTRQIPASLLITHGLSGSGKSTVSGNLLMKLPLVRIRSDIERKRLAELAPNAPSGSPLDGGIYTTEYTTSTYQRLLWLSGIILKAGYSVIVDATFHRLSQRRPFQMLARQLGVPFLILDFKVPENELRWRVLQRWRAGGDPSEAGIEVLERQIDTLESLTDEERVSALTVAPDRDVEPEEVVGRLRQC